MCQGEAKLIDSTLFILVQSLKPFSLRQTVKNSNVSLQFSRSGYMFNFFIFLVPCLIFDTLFFCRCFLRARGYIYLQKTPDVLCVWVLPSCHSSRSPQLDFILDWPRIHPCPRLSWSDNYSSHGELPPRRRRHSKCVLRNCPWCVRHHVFCVCICQLDGVCCGALCANEISRIKHEWGMLTCNLEKNLKN